MRAMNETSAGQTTCAAFWVKGIAETLEAAGLDIPALFEEAELELAALSDADARFPTEGISRLWQLAATRSGNPAIGLMNSSDVKPGSFDVVAYAMMSSPNLLGILERAVRYVEVAGSWGPAGQRALWGFDVSAEVDGGWNAARKRSGCVDRRGGEPAMGISASDRRE